jgi:hypothetical protein
MMEELGGVILAVLLLVGLVYWGNTKRKSKNRDSEGSGSGWSGTDEVLTKDKKYTGPK